MATWFQQKIEEDQESGFHFIVWKSCVFRVRTFQADSLINVPFCSVLSSCSTSSPFGCITSCSYFDLFFYSLIVSFLFAFSDSPCIPFVSFKIPGLPFPNVQAVSLPNKAEFSFQNEWKFRFTLSPAPMSFQSHHSFPALISISPAVSFSLAAAPFFSPQVPICTSWYIALLLCLLFISKSLA